MEDGLDDLACWIHFSGIPHGLVLQINLVCLEFGVGFCEGDLDLSVQPVSMNVRARSS